MRETVPGGRYRVRTMTRIIAVLNQKGGVGKTTTVANLGAALARRGRRVLLLDLDPQANLTVHVGLEPREAERTTYSLLLGDDDLASVVRDTGVPGLRIVPSTLALANAEIQLASAVGRELILREAIETWLDPLPPLGGGDAPEAGEADFILIDCPPSLGIITMNALCAATDVLLPIQAEFFALQGVAGLLESLKAVQRLNRRARLSLVVPCMVDLRTNLARDVVQEVRQYFGQLVSGTLIRKNVRLAEAPSHGQTIFEYAPGSRGAEDYDNLALEILGGHVDPYDIEPKTRGMVYTEDGEGDDGDDDAESAADEADAEAQAEADSGAGDDEIASATTPDEAVAPESGVEESAVRPAPPSSEAPVAEAVAEVETVASAEPAPDSDVADEGVVAQIAASESIDDEEALTVSMEELHAQLSEALASVEDADSDQVVTGEVGTATTSSGADDETDTPPEGAWIAASSEVESELRAERESAAETGPVEVESKRGPGERAAEQQGSGARLSEQRTSADRPPLEQATTDEASTHAAPTEEPMTDEDTAACDAERSSDDRSPTESRLPVADDQDGGAIAGSTSGSDDRALASPSTDESAPPSESRPAPRSAPEPAAVSATRDDDARKSSKRSVWTRWLGL